MDPLKAHLNPNSKAINQGNPAFQKESIINLQNYMDKEIRIKFNGGREITGILKEYDTSLNMIIDSCYEFLRGK